MCKRPFDDGAARHAGRRRQREHRMDLLRDGSRPRRVALLGARPRVLVTGSRESRTVYGVMKHSFCQQRYSLFVTRLRHHTHVPKHTCPPRRVGAVGRTSLLAWRAAASGLTALVARSGVVVSNAAWAKPPEAAFAFDDVRD